jgi:predicted ribosome quality control (RQC) complex YloA/Tae2 family protein
MAGEYALSMRITIDTRKTIEQNAAAYFERAKKAKKKLEGAKKALELAQERMRQHAEAMAEKKPEAKQEPRPQRKQEWYEKLRWFISSDGFLCIGGRDATTNEMVVKRHALKGDIVFHTDMAGSPFTIIKAEGRDVPMTTLEEAAQFCAAFSRAWKNGFSYLEVFYVAPEQLSKEPNPGEFLPKGAFVVRGSVKYLMPKIEICIGKDKEGRVMVAPERAVLAHCGRGFIILQGNEKTSDVAKRLAKLLDAHIDEIVPLLPPGGVKLGKEIKRD